jgi:hypothetical protein
MFSLTIFICKYSIIELLNLFFHIYMKMDGRSWMYWSSDVLAHFKELCAFLETTIQYASHQKEETIYYTCKVCTNTWFGVVSWIINLFGLSMVRHNSG